MEDYFRRAFSDYARGGLIVTNIRDAMIEAPGEAECLAEARLGVRGQR